MSIRVLDPNGRTIRSVSSAKAHSWVEHARARWLHADDVQPNRERGTIILNCALKELPEERVMTQIFNGDGELLGWLWMDTSELWIRKKRMAQVGASSEDGPRAAILPHVVDPRAMDAIRRIEGWRIAEGLKARAAVRAEIESAMSAMAGEQLEDMILSAVSMRLGKGEADLVLKDLREMRRRIVAMEIALAPDMADVRQELAYKI
jgi:hypothetical protein